MKTELLMRVLEEAIDNEIMGEGHEDEVSEPLMNIEDMATFREAGVMTLDEGLVIRMKDGSEFQLTIQRSK